MVNRLQEVDSAHRRRRFIAIPNHLGAGVVDHTLALENRLLLDRVGRPQVAERVGAEPVPTAIATFYSRFLTADPTRLMRTRA